MAVDITPKLWESIERDFQSSLKRSRRAQHLLRRIAEGKADYGDANELAKLIGRFSSDALEKKIKKDILPDGRMYYNIANKTIRPALDLDYEIMSDAAQKVQQIINEEAETGLKAIKAEEDEDRVDGLIDKITGYDDFDDAKWLLGSPIENFVQSIVDDTAEANADFWENTGKKAYIIRLTDGKCCKWCSAIAGKYEYPDCPHDVFRRHENCGCQVIFDGGDGKYQNVHTKRNVTDSRVEERIRQEEEKLEERKTLNLDDKPKTLYGKTGKELDEYLAQKPETEEMLERAKKFRNVKDNFGLIADRVASGQYLLNLKHQKYLQHVEGTGLFKNAEKTRGRKQSFLTVSEDQAQALIWKYAGTGTLSRSSSGYNLTREYFTVDFVIGKTWEGGILVNTRRAMIIYGADGAHIVPVNSGGYY